MRPAVGRAVVVLPPGDILPGGDEGSCKVRVHQHVAAAAVAVTVDVGPVRVCAYVAVLGLASFGIPDVF